jgi:hypothetical protein
LRWAIVEPASRSPQGTFEILENTLYNSYSLPHILVCVLAVAFIKDFDGYEVLRKLLNHFCPEKTIVYEVIRLTSLVQTLIDVLVLDFTLVNTLAESAEIPRAGRNSRLLPIGKSAHCDHDVPLQWPQI